VQSALVTQLPQLAVLALISIPTLYAGLYLYANANPYANLGHVPAEIAVQDKGGVLAC
jgi:putative membrane protein